MQGWVGPLDEAPDAVFAKRILGDGLAIDPTMGLLASPCDGVVTSLARTLHALTIRMVDGPEILMHVGIDTVALGGGGFQALVTEGQAVESGAPLLTFDLDVLAHGSISLISPVVVTNGEAFEIVRRSADGLCDVGDFLMELRPRNVAAAKALDPIVEVSVDTEIVTGLSHGLHARPAARLAQVVKDLDAEVTLSVRGRLASARSVVSMMTLGLGRGDAVEVRARGPQAAKALQAAVSALEPLPISTPAALGLSLLRSGDPGTAPLVLNGTRAVPGVSIGVAARMFVMDRKVEAVGRGVEMERAALAQALTRVRSAISERAMLNGPAAAISAAHIALLEDPLLLGGTELRIVKGESASAAWRTELRTQAQALGALTDPRMRERRADLLDLERQVLSALAGEQDRTELPRDAIVLAQELLPSELADLDPERLIGVAMRGGGPTSHVAIMGAAMGVPMLMAVGAGLEAIEEGTPLILDAGAGCLQVRPGSADLERAIERRDRRAARRAVALAGAASPCRTADGIITKVFANIGSLDEVAVAVTQGAEGCGLLRTEFLFAERETAPDEEEQRAAYQIIADGLGGRPLVVRTLDIGADKPVAWLTLPWEENPALGLRGIRTSLLHPHLLRTQLRALLRVRASRLSVLLPMIASAEELHSAADILQEEAQALGVSAWPLGVMIETPAAAVTSNKLAATASFFSIGTNDLTQYALAMDRTHPMLASRLDGLHPAVLELVWQTVKGAAIHRRPVGVCGGLATDLIAVPLLLGLGITELSTAPAQVADVKAAVRTLRLDDCQALAQQALGMACAAEVRAAVAARWPQLGDAA